MYAIILLAANSNCYRGGSPETEAVAITTVGRTDRMSFLADCGKLHADFKNPAPFKSLATAGGLLIACIKTGELSVCDGTATVQSLSAVLDKAMKAPGIFQDGPLPVGEAFAQGWEANIHLNL